MKTTWATVHSIFPDGQQSGDWYNTKCILCGRDAKLGIKLDSDGTFHTNCFVCGDNKSDDVYDAVREALEKGAPVEHTNAPVKIKQHTFRFSEEQLQRAEAALEKHPEAVAYLQSRGITLETAKQNRTGYVDHWRIGPSVVMSSFNDKGELVEAKFRSITGKLFDKTNKTPGEHWLFGRDVIPEASLTGKPLLLTESQLDAMTAQNAGFLAVSVDSAGHRLSPADLAALKSLPRVILAADNDPDGHKCAQYLARELGPDRCLRVTPPKKDIGDLYNDHPTTFPEVLGRLIRASQLTCVNFKWDDLLTEDELIDQQGLEIDYIVDQLIPRQRITMLYGSEKSCKSLIAYYLGKCTANGARALDNFTTAKSPCLYIDAEDGFLGKYAGWMRGIGGEKVRLRTLRTGIPALDDPALLEICKTLKPLIIVDSLHKFLPPGSNPWNSAQYEPVLAALRLLCIAGATVILIHHSTRADREKYRDSNAIGAGVDFLFAVVAEKGEDGITRVKLIGQPSRGAQPPTLHLIGFPALIEKGKFLIEEQPPKTDEDIVVEFVASQHGANKKKIRSEVKGMRNERKDAALEKAVANHRLILDDNGNYACPERGTDENSMFAPEMGHDAGTMTYESEL